jgi:hypothetical protein
MTAPPSLPSRPSLLGSVLTQGSAWLSPDDPTAALLWTPLPGPQTQALESEADELLYGGAGGGGKTDLELGLALTRHTKSVIFRREYRQLADVVRRGKDLIEDRARFNGTALAWTFPDGRSIELGAVEHLDDVRKWRGRPHDLKAFDELSEFLEEQYLFLGGWARTTAKGQRVRIVGATNPPQTADGEWIIQRWGAWLDAQHPNPAAPGELRWYVRIDGKEVEREDGAPFDYLGETLYPKSRTFVPARLDDNPYLASDSQYRATLQALPEPLRSQLLYGDFSIGLEDDPWQVIPTAWVRAAQARWTPEGRDNRPLTATGVDVAQGGQDSTALACRYDDWCAEVELIPGVDVPDASVNARQIERVVAEGGYVAIDVDGIGESTYHLLRPTLGGRVRAYAGSAGTTFKGHAGVLEFANVRAAAYWHLRDLLDPSRYSMVALPPDRRVLADLTAPRWSKPANKIQLEKKADIKARLGRSPDCGDAIVMAFWDDPAAWFAEAIGKGMYFTGRLTSGCRPMRRHAGMGRR